MAGESELSEGEHSVLLLHPHWKILLRPTLVLVLVAVVAAVLVVVIPQGSYAAPGRAAVGVVAVVAVVAWFAIPFLRWQTTTYELTTRRLRLRRGVLSRSGRDFPLIRISDVSFSHGLVDRLLGCGQLVVESAGERGQIRLENVPKVELVQRTLYRLADEHRGAPVRPAPEDMFDAGLGSRPGSHDGGGDGDESRR